MKNTNTGNRPNVSRRKFIIGSAAAAGGGLALGFNLPFGVAPAAAQGAAAVTPELTVWVVVKPDDSCVIRVARAEMGQGTHTGLAQLVAEELECDWKKVTIEAVTAGKISPASASGATCRPAAAAASAPRRTTFAAAAPLRA